LTVNSNNFLCGYPENFKITLATIEEFWYKIADYIAFLIFYSNFAHKF